MKKNILIVGIILIFIISSFAPLSFGINIDIKKQLISETSDFNRHLYPEYYNCYNKSEIPKYGPIDNDSYDKFNNYILSDPYSPEINIPEPARIEAISTSFMETGLMQSEKQKEEPELNIYSANSPIDSPWPMYCHDVRNTGRSPFNTDNNPGTEKWKFSSGDYEVTGSPVIDDEGSIYFGAGDLFAVYPNGTKKWKSKIDGIITSASAIDENGVLYVGIIWGHPSVLYAIYTNNGTHKWEYNIGPTWASPTVGQDGIIYVPATDNWNVFAFYPNGTVKWKFHANEKVYSSPAISNDGTIYVNSWDKHLYALHPNNGTIKWKYDTGGRIRTSPCIDDNGIIYTVSATNGILSAFYPNGTLKWTTYVHGGTSPTVGADGTIYCGWTNLYAINPEDGTIKWTYDPGEDRRIEEGTPCTSAEGTIYFGTHIGETDGGELIAVNPDGNERWRIKVATVWVMSAPAIGEDGTVYVGSFDRGPPHGWGWLHAIGDLDANSPAAPVINGETEGDAGKEYQYTFKSTSPLGRDVYYYIEWGDGNIKNWFGPYDSSEEIAVNHTYTNQKTYIIKSRAKDTENLWGPWGELKVTMPKNKAVSYPYLLRLLEKFPLFKEVLLRLINP